MSLRRRRILVDARTPVHYAMFAPVHRAMDGDDRVRFSFIASDEPAQAASIFRDAGAERAPSSARVAAALHEVRRLPDVGLHVDAAAAPHLPHPDVPRRRRQVRLRRADRVAARVAPAVLRQPPAAEQLHRRRRARRRQPGDPPDRHAEGRLPRRRIAQPRRGPDGRSAFPPDRPTVLYAPTWSPASSLNLLGVDAARSACAQLPVNVIVKLHDRSLRPAAAVLGRHRLAGGARAASRRRDRRCWRRDADICPYLAAADVMVTDHSSAGFEYLLLDRPLVRIHVPELIALANIHQDYVRLLADVSESTSEVDDTVAAVERALADPASRARRRAARSRPTCSTSRERRPRAARTRSTKRSDSTSAVPLTPTRRARPERSARRESLHAGRQRHHAGVQRRARISATAVESVLRQSFTDLELLIVDDGSSDRTVEIARGFAASRRARARAAAGQRRARPGAQRRLPRRDRPPVRLSRQRRRVGRDVSRRACRDPRRAARRRRR